MDSLKTMGGACTFVGQGWHRVVSYRPKRLRIPDADMTAVVELRHKLQPPRRRPKRIQKKLDKRHGRKHLRSIESGFVTTLPGRPEDLTPDQRRKFVVLSQILVQSS